MTKIVVTTKEELSAFIREIVQQPIEDLKTSINELVKPSKKNFTVKEVAVHLNVSELTVRNYIAKGFIRADKIGRRVIISSENLESALSEVKSLKYRR
ncbi:helix-turn-helix domain-containing protein [Bizionia gelidisalsuginis]|uniref:Helix-turn-helix domain-containing protein n=1 Tax=Bizionia gelidisalsuginis TaxID=291188 RepID=A0ABY3MBX5_9FLAO|nr:helix-turn-helix domain-containing protein [Bizionia gelidisalsuginis]TYC14796.1 helix-turn-helix domain-containing protein [Bizionia gelidisalsuginis]